MTATTIKRAEIMKTASVWSLVEAIRKVLGAPGSRAEKDAGHARTFTPFGKNADI
jgi:hypothetical protein